MERDEWKGRSENEIEETVRRLAIIDGDRE